MLLVLSATALLACENEWYVPLLAPPADSGPVLWMWVGAEDEAPPCIDGQPPKWEGWMPETPEGLPDTCDACECGPAACVLPSKVMTSGMICPGGGPSIALDAGAGWDGTCAALPSPVQPDDVASIVYEPPTLSPCTPSATPQPPPVPASFVRVCAGNTAQDPPGFIPCMESSREESCRNGLTRHEFFEELIDDRACAPCECGPPAGGRCVADVGLYGDSACSDRVNAAISLGLGEESCADVSSPLPLSAMRATLVEAEPGACSPGAPAVLGTLERREPHVVCSFPEI
ncbi:hypothetical protein [Sorangium sp. So ce887]|uniref:hypothetical protein n=1 Tax=Sorangium sp. So ce887 TaxID=3133324 RepID=UPI003F61BE65